MNKTALIALAAGAVAFSSSTASAQTAEPDRIFVNLNAGAQMQSHTLTSSLSFPLYNQTASVNTAQTIETGPFFDFTVGARVRNDLGVAFGYAMFENASDLNGSASIPHPLFFDSPRQVDFTTGAEHKERNFYVLAVWFLPIRDRLDAMISGGPSFIRVQQATLSTVTVPNGTQDVIPAVAEEEGWGTGINVGGDITYQLFATERVRIGLGGFLRYNGASVELPSGAELDAGGFQGGAGLRFRF